MRSPGHEYDSLVKPHAGSARPALLRYPVIGVSVLLALCAPGEASARTDRGSVVTAAARPSQRQLRILHAYERYLTRVAAQRAAARRAVHFAYRQMGKP